MNVVAVRRSVRYSPNSEENDRLILQAVADLLLQRGHRIEIVLEDCLQDSDCLRVSHDLWLSMGRMPSTLRLLKEKEQRGEVVLNSPYGVESCARSHLEAVMRSNSVAMPPTEGCCGWWVKRGDAAAQDAADVVFCPTTADVAAARRAFDNRGITDVVVSAHVEGDLVKFYGVEGTGFFHTMYPTSVGRSKFGAEEVNGMPNYYTYDRALLQEEAERLSRLVHTPIYGGDCIIDSHGHIHIIDFNDWPSFSPCRAEAADAIVELAMMKTDSQ